ncbi:hypothetical protein [Micromonospora sp. KC723]|nr:hypothetical protein [Micromonospora sp. KC723]
MPGPDPAVVAFPTGRRRADLTASTPWQPRVPEYARAERPGH